MFCRLLVALQIRSLRENPIIAQTQPSVQLSFAIKSSGARLRLHAQKMGAVVDQLVYGLMDIG